ncbi:ABC transporter substrate-binding protein [Pelomonas sp. Root1217]|uniref:substrate-binding periplasmic protein n=1 Tax=Pelomonas sp. Root1217 TaxID=1736430 RepID=UPI00070D7E52|nr:transporter substrate-binding domain-containing protein [Pelomonas sp. Root1217]
MTRRRAALALLSTLGMPVAQAAQPLLVTIPQLSPSSQEHASYFPRLLRLALEQTQASDGPFEIQHHEQPMSGQRQFVELKNSGAINVIWDGSNTRREAELLPVRFSLLRDLNDYRVFLIRKGDQARFRAVRTLTDLSRFTAGAGEGWPSTDVLRANGLPVVTSVNYEQLFAMLGARRFDYMPRGVYEAWYEQQQHSGLVIEQTLFLHYSVPFYFFTSRDNPALADRIERGLRAALADGSFDRLFRSIPSFRRSLDEIHAGRRRVLELELPPD